MWVETKRGGLYAGERYKDPITGKVKKMFYKITADTPSQRRAANKELERRINNIIADSAESKDLLLSELVDLYREEQEYSVKQSTYGRNKGACNTLMAILGEDTLVNGLTAPYVRTRLLKSGKENSTLNELLKRFHALVRWGYRRDYIADISFLEKIEPFQDVPHRVKIEDKFLESDELDLLLKSVKHPVYYNLIRFLALSGMRFGEATALDMSDIDIPNKYIYVTKNFDYVHDTITTPKNAPSIRDVYIQPELMSAVKDILAYDREQSIACGYRQNKIFIQSLDGGRVTHAAFNKYLKSASKRSIGRAITPHALRHTHVSLLFEQGMSLDEIARRVGHVDSKVTREIYLHITKKLKLMDNKKLAQIRIL